MNVYFIKVKSNMFLPSLLYYSLTSIGYNYTAGKKSATIIMWRVRLNLEVNAWAITVCVFSVI